MIHEYTLPQLEVAVKRDLIKLDYPQPEWVLSRPGILDVLIIGGGQGGLSIAFGLMLEKVRNILVLDENPPGQEGPWRTFARMKTLRSPKHLTGPDLGIANLTFQAWYEAKYGLEAFEQLDLASKEDWADYLEWFRRILEIPIRNDAKAGVIEWNAGKQAFVVPTMTPEGIEILWARKVVLATGIDGCGRWEVPNFIKKSVSEQLFAHTHDVIDFSRLYGKRIGVLGAGASAFDNAIVALEAGANEVRLFCRRQQLPNINPFRWGLFAGYLNHHSDMPDEDRWRFLLYQTRQGMPPPPATLHYALNLPGFSLHTGSSWDAIQQVEDIIQVTTSQGVFEFDYLIIGTGTITNLSFRPELAQLEPFIARWQDRYTPSQAECHADLAQSPYLGSNFELTERTPGITPYLNAVFNFTYGAMLSHGTSGSAIHGLKYSVPKIVSGITRQLFLEDRETYYQSMLAFDVTEFEQPATEARALSQL